MMKKIFILGLMVCSFLVVSISPVIAAGETHTITDATGDVVDSEGNVVSEKKDIDIEKVTCAKDGKHVELKLKLTNSSTIQNSDWFFYVIYLITSENKYEVDYYNDSCTVTDFEQNEIEDFDYSGNGTDTLTVSFSLNGNEEEYVFAYAVSTQIDEENYYYDSIPGDDIPMFYDDDFPAEGVVGESNDFSVSIDGGTSPYTWKWNFGDGKTSDEQDATHVYDEAGTYKVIVLVTDDNGYSDIFYSTLDITASENGNNNGGDSNGESLNSGLILFAVIIVAIVLVGIAVIVYMIRR